MKFNGVLILMALIYNVVNFLLWQQTKSTGGGSLILVIIYPCFWLLTLIIVAILSKRFKKIWFKRDYLFSALLALIFCTPVPFLVGKAISAKKANAYLVSTGFDPENGHTIKYEEWNYDSGELEVIKYWKANGEDSNQSDSSQYKRDSSWVYFDEKHDTLKIETYKDGKLVSFRKFNR